MKRLGLLIVFIATTAIAFSQKKTVHFGLSVNVKNIHQIFDDPEYSKSDDEISYSTAANIYYDLSSTFQLISGLSFNHYQINQIDYSPGLGCDFNGASFDPFNSYYKEKYNTSYLGIPVEIRWKIVGEANHLFLQFGVEGLIKIALDKSLVLVECNGVAETNLEHNDFKNVNNFLLLSKLGLGYEFQLSKKMKLFFEPNIEYSLSKFFKSGSGNCKFINFGLNTGIKF